MKNELKIVPLRGARFRFRCSSFSDCGLELSGEKDEPELIQSWESSQQFLRQVNDRIQAYARPTQSATKTQTGLSVVVFSVVVFIFTSFDDVY